MRYGCRPDTFAGIPPLPVDRFTTSSPRSVVSMSLVRLFTQRIALGLVAVWGVLTIVFAMFMGTRHWGIQQEIGMAQWAGEDLSEAEEQARIDAYLAERNLDGSLTERYLEWTVDMFLLRWGDSFETGEAVFPLVLEATGRTLMYVLPAVALAVVAGVLIGLLAALRPGGSLATGTVAVAYTLFALPNFFVGGMALSYTSSETVAANPWLFAHALPIGLTATSLLGGYVSFTRAQALESAGEEFITLVRAKGATPRRLATHVVRNGAIPLFSMLFTEVFALLVLSVFVIETLFAIEGLGFVLFEAIETRDLPVLLGGTMVIIAIGVACNIIQDASYTVLDPRVDTDTR